MYCLVVCTFALLACGEFMLGGAMLQTNWRAICVRVCLCVGSMCVCVSVCTCVCTFKICVQVCLCWCVSVCRRACACAICVCWCVCVCMCVCVWVRVCVCVRLRYVYGYLIFLFAAPLLITGFPSLLPFVPEVSGCNHHAVGSFQS